jgi:hypothetical protein
VGKSEYAKPDQEYRIVEDETVKQKRLDVIGIHGDTSYFPSLKGYLPSPKRFMQKNSGLIIKKIKESY